ncbi:MAG TPA: cation:proton antiporter [Acidimicrobiales bacterium]|nr:cation:proton antiporter [Acidimicrobiales bacterium]
MIPLVAAASGETAVVFIEIGAIALVLSVLARLAGRLGITAIPLYLLAGLAVGEGGVVPLDVSADFIQLAGEIGVLLLLLTLGLEYSGDELRHGLRTGAAPGVIDAVANFTPGLVVGLVLGWAPAVALLLGGVCWVSSSGVVSKVLTDLDRLGNRETPAVLNLLVIEDLAMAVYLPVVGALIVGRGAADTTVTVAIALAAVGVILAVALRWGDHLSRLLAPASDEALLLAVFGLTLLVGGLAQEVQVSAAIGAFLVGLALSGSVQARAAAVVGPLRDLFAATFFLFFSFSVDPSDLVGVLVPAGLLAVLGILGKLLSGWFAARSAGAGTPGRLRAGTVLIARGEFSVVIAALGAATADGAELGALAAAYVLMTAIAGPLAAKLSDRMASRLVRTG